MTGQLGTSTSYLQNIELGVGAIAGTDTNGTVWVAANGNWPQPDFLEPIIVSY